MQRKLKDIAKIQPGHPFREGIRPVLNGNVRVVQIKDVGAGTLIETELVRVMVDNVNPDFFVRSGDVLFTTRGNTRRAAAVAAELNDAIFVAQIFVLRNLAAGVLPDYLAWFLNQTRAQEYFDIYSSGGFVQNVRKNVLAEISIDIPSVETQRLVLNIAGLRRREKALIRQIEECRDVVIDDVLAGAISRSN